MEVADDDVFLVAVDALGSVDVTAGGVAVAREALVVLVRRHHLVARVQHEPDVSNSRKNLHKLPV